MTFHEEMVAKYGLKHLPESWVYKKAGKSRCLVLGVGYSDIEFACQIKILDKKLIHPAYEHWRGLLRRCFDPVEKSKHTTYENANVCTDWLKFSKFLSWWEMNYTVGYSLDKDLLIRGNKYYSPDTCLFIPKSINSFLTTSSKTRGEYCLGVHRHNNKFRAQISILNKNVTIGYYETEIEAHKAWQQSKLKRAKELKQEYALEQLQYVINRLQADIDENKITETI